MQLTINSVVQPFRAVAILLSIALVACGDPSAVDDGGDSNVFNVSDDDPDMNAAIAKARASVEGFIEQLPRLRDEGAYFSVKVPISAGGVTEHVWLSDPEYRDGVFERS